MQLLSECDSSVAGFSFENQRVIAKIVSVYDGDTVSACVLVGGRPFKWSVRLAGIDTCELRTSVAREKEHALVAKKRVEELCLNKLVVLDCCGRKTFDKYGRILARVMMVPRDAEDSLVDDFKEKCTRCLNDVLVEEKLAIVYDGTGKERAFQKLFKGCHREEL